jgi:transcriptional regulator with XRE-family HTH domain
LKTVGHRIQRMRKERRLSQEEFAQLAKLDRSYYGRIERGGQNLELKTVMLIAKALEVAPTVLLADLTYADCEKLWNETETRRRSR